MFKYVLRYSSRVRAPTALTNGQTCLSVTFFFSLFLGTRQWRFWQVSDARESKRFFSGPLVWLLLSSSSSSSFGVALRTRWLISLTAKRFARDRTVKFLYSPYATFNPQLDLSPPPITFYTFFSFLKADGLLFTNRFTPVRSVCRENFKISTSKLKLPVLVIHTLCVYTTYAYLHVGGYSLSESTACVCPAKVSSSIDYFIYLNEYL